jgi:hypothetical protein
VERIAVYLLSSRWAVFTTGGTAMAKKQAAEKKPVSTVATEEEVKAVRLELPPNLHKELRIEAAKRDTHMSALARVAVEEFLDRARKAGGK